MSIIHELERMCSGGQMIKLYPSTDGVYHVSITVGEKEIFGSSNFSLVQAIEEAIKSVYVVMNA